MRRPKSDPFEPQPRHEDVRGARFWPDTLFVDLSAYPDEVQSFEYDALRFWDDCDPRVLVAATARTHEQLHWLQTAGTSFGRFLAVNRLTTGELADAILTTATPREIGLLVDARRRGIAPAARDGHGRLRHALGYSTTLQSLFDHWWSTVALEHYLVDNGASLLGPVDPRFMTGLSLRYAAAGNGLRDVFNAPDDAFMETTRTFGPRDELPFAPIRSGLSVRHIEEAAATILQHLCGLSFARMLEGERHVEFGKRVMAWMLERCMDDRHSLYTQASAHFSAHAPETSARRQLELFLLICDIALNPRIPDDGSPLAADWSDFHPVCRFERLVSALDGFMPDDSMADEDPPSGWWLSERARLVERAGLSDGAMDGAFCRPIDGDINPLEAPCDYMRRFIAMAGRNLDRVRGQFPAAIASPIHALRADTDGMVALLAELSGPAFDPPLNIRSVDDGEPSASINNRDYVETLLAVTARRATHSWLVRPGDLNFRGLSADRAGMRAREAATERLETLYSIQ